MLSVIPAGIFSRLRIFLGRLKPHALPVARRHIVLGSIGAGTGLAVTSMFSHWLLGEVNLWFIAPMGASAVLLFGVPSSPLAQPWSIVGGNVLSALIGVTVGMLVPDAALACGLAAALAIAGMYFLRCLHPPGGAVALTAILGGAGVHSEGYHFVLTPVLLNSLMLALLAFGGFALWQDAALRRGAFVGAELLQYKPAAPAADNPTLAELQTVNPDVCGWLTVDGTGIDYPVVQGATNMDYVNRDVYGDFSLSGAIFLDSRCAADLTDPYTVIYGHHMDNSAMFGDVARFAEADYFAAHPAGSISLPDAAYTIELFACVVTDAYDTAIYTPERYHDDVGALLDYAAAQAVQQRDIGVTAQDRLVALSTCAGSETNGRVVVLGRLCPLKEGDEMQ